MHRLRPALAAASLTLGLLALTACATGAPAEAETPPPSPASSPTVTPTTLPSTTPAPTASSIPAPEQPTPETIDCDTMVEPTVATGLRGQGMSPAPKAWSQFGFEPTGAALECPWGFADSTTSDAFYAWAALEPGQDAQFLALVLENGYLTEHSERGTWLVAPPESAGGGEIATLVTSEWVAFADSRDRIDDIVWTR